MSPGARILLVDDEPALRRTLERALRALGYEVVTAADGHTAYERLDEAAFDLVLLDLRLPHLTGDALFLAIIRRWSWMRGRVILMSGDPWSMQKDWPPELQECPILPKPFTLEALARTVEGALARVAQRPERRQGNGG